MRFCVCLTLQFLVTLVFFVSPLFAASPQLVLPDGQSFSFQEMDKLLADDGAAGDYFGYSVAISGETMVISSDWDDDNGSDSGSAYIFERSDGVWSQVQKLTAGDGAADDSFGKSVAVSGETVVVGSYWDDDNGTYSGSGYIFERSDGVWSQVQKLTAGDGAEYDRFGRSVAVSGETVVIGSYGDDDNGSYSGSAYIFERSDGVWSQVQKLTAGDGAKYDHFGRSVAISGETMAIGSYGDDDNGSASGSAYIFERSDGVWSQRQKLTAGDGAADDEFGTSVAVSGETVVISSYCDDDNGSNSGSAYIFESAAPHYNSLEGKRPVIELEAADSNSDYPISFSLLSGLDSSLFTLDSSGPTNSAVLQFTTAPDFEAPADSNGNNLYELYLQLVDTAGEVNKYGLSVRVEDIPYEQTLPRALTYQELQKLQASSPTENAWFGNSVAISGETAVVGASGYGRAYVYVYSETSGLYEYKADLRPDVAGDVSAFGQDVAVSGDTIAVVDPWFNSYTGAVYVFEKPAEAEGG